MEKPTSTFITCNIRSGPFASTCNMKENKKRNRRAGTFGLGGGGGGGGEIIARKKLHNARKHVLYKRTQIAVKTKTFTILASNERIIIPKLQLNPDFLNLQGKRKLVRKIGYFEKSGVTKITMFD